jgi:hypothetical protein
MGRKLKNDEDPLTGSSSSERDQAPPSPKKSTISTQLSTGNMDPLPLTVTLNPFLESLDKPFENRNYFATTQDAIQTVNDLSKLLLEPRPIEEMRNDPLNVEESFAGFWPTEV